MMKRMRALTISVLALCAGPVCALAAAPVAYVPPVSQVITAARLQQISDAWARRLVKDNDHQVILAYPLTDQHVIAGHIELRTSGASTISPSYANLPIEIRVDGTLIRTVYTGYRIVALVSTPVLLSAKHRGDILAISDFHNVSLPDDGRPPIDLNRLVGKTLNSDALAGAVIHEEQTAVNNVVKAGTPVVLIVHDGPVALAADVVARTSGGIGETVTVYDEDARRVLSGIVTAPSRVELTLPEVSN